METKPFCARRAPGPCRGHSPGLSMLEMLAVITILAILASAAVVGLSGFLTRSGLIRQTDEFVIALRKTRDSAMESRRPWRMGFQPGNSSWSSYCDGNENGRQDPGEKVLGPQILRRGVSFGSLADTGPNRTALPADGVSFADDEVCFSPLGTCNSGSLYLTDRHASTALRVMPASGAVIVWHYRGGWVESR